MAIGCTSSGTQVVQQNCPPPYIPKCAPGSYNETKLDTLFHGMGSVQNHIVAAPYPFSTNASDFGVANARIRNTSLQLVTSNRANLGGTLTSAHDGLWVYQDGRVVAVSGLDTTQSVGAAVYSAADGRLYYSTHAPDADPDDYDLYSARAEFASGELQLSDIRPLATVNAHDKFDSQPAIDWSGKTLIFVSDRSGGVGGTDLWVSHRASISDAWSAPELLDGAINTECDELSPSYATASSLYFASNGHSTVGGYDLFRSHLANGKYSEPENLGRPINTEFDELFPLSLNDTTFYWSSNRPEGPVERNIYTITRSGYGKPTTLVIIPEDKPRLERIDSIPTGPVDLYVDVTRGESGAPATGAELFVRHDSTEIYRGKSPNTGKFKIKLNRDVYDVGAENSSSFFDVKRIDLRTERDSTVRMTLNVPDTLTLRINFPFDDHEHPYEFVIDDAGNAGTMTWKRALDLTARATLASIGSLKKLIVIGHTDSLGSDAYNSRLGLQRAQFVADELVKRGVPKRIVSVRSRGRTEPVAIRPEESDEQFRLRSRRVEFVKVF